MIRAALAFVMLVVGGPAAAATLELPVGALRTAEQLDPLGSYAVPTAPWTPADGVPVNAAEGRVLREAWSVPGAATTLQLLSPLRAQLQQQGFRILLDCETDLCGGFDFRFEIELLPEPEMHVDLGDFRYLSARRGSGAEAEYVTLMVSRSTTTGFIHVVSVVPFPVEPLAEPEALVTSATPAPEGDAATPPAGPEAAPGAEPAPARPAPVAGIEPGSIALQLEAAGRAILPGLTFETGSARLAEEPAPVLDELAAYLNAHPTRRVTLVGHTDAEGSLAANIALSRSRARAVLDRLVADYGVSAAQLEADGVGYLMPLAPNTTEEGRALNRRVEAVLTSTE